MLENRTRCRFDANLPSLEPMLMAIRVNLRRWGRPTLASLCLLASAVCWMFIGVSTEASAQQLRLEFSPANTTINFALGDLVHTVRGSFLLKQGNVQYDFSTANVTGALVIDAASGNSGNRIRDRKMHREILESARYSEITFRPDRLEGEVAPSGSFTVKVHGIFSVHGADHELTMPVRVQVLPDHWTADAHFTIPYVKWGIKNPSSFLLRVSESVEIAVHATGGRPLATNGQR
jgi:polyisoprenoid-binding protein YceI